MKIIEKNNSVIIEGINDFDPVHTFECGQCFRWEVLDNGTYTGVAFSRPVNIITSGNSVEICNITLAEFESCWKHYFDFDTDYKKIKSEISVDENVKKAMEFGWGIKILNQEIFECLISFIISTQNAIFRIKRIVAKLCEMYGDKLEYDGRVFYSFPRPEQLAGVTEADLAPLKAGYRAAYIVDAVNKVNSGEIKLEQIKNMSYKDAKAELMKIRGVGPKVADCVLLFSGEKKRSVPDRCMGKKNCKNFVP